MRALGVRLFGVTSAIVLLAYPFCVYFGLEYFGPRTISGFLLALFALRYLTQKGHDRLLSWNVLPLVTLLGTLFCLLVFSVNRAELLKFYPVLMNLFFLTLFTASLWRPPTVIERVARIQHPNLSPRGVRHTRQVTVAWCIFFILNAGIALYTALFSAMATWTLYNGFLSYLAMGLMFVVEYPVRRARMAKDQREALKPC